MDREAGQSAPNRDRRRVVCPDGCSGQGFLICLAFDCRRPFRSPRFFPEINLKKTRVPEWWTRVLHDDQAATVRALAPPGGEIALGHALLSTSPVQTIA